MDISFTISSIGFLLSGIFLVILPVMICIYISLENRNPSKTISWILVLTLLPGLGFVCYLLFGENLRKKKWDRRRQAVQEFLDSLESEHMLHVDHFDGYIRAGHEHIKLDKADQNMMRMVLKSGVAPITIYNHIDIFVEGEEKFRRLLEDIEQATQHIHLEYFIIKKSSIGNKIKDALIRKAKQGVEVRVMYDDIGSWRLYFHPAFTHELRQAGCQVKSYVQARFPYLHRNLNYRNHRKICVIDGKIGYLGGLNIGDEYIHLKKKFGYWRDTHLRIEGQAVQMLQVVFITDWLIRTDIRLLDKKYFPKHSERNGQSIVQIAISGADSVQQTIYQGYFYVIAQAKETIYIETPYFIPDEALMTALKTAALAGVEIKIIFPHIADHYIVYHASLSYLEEIMELGAKVYLYTKGFIHSKVLLVDHEIASVGTANMDIRSFMLNSEINGFIYDNQTVAKLYTMFEADLCDCVQLDYEQFKQKKLPQKLRESFCRLFSPLL